MNTSQNPKTKACQDCGTHENVCRDGDGIDRCNACSHAKFWHKRMYAPDAVR